MMIRLAHCARVRVNSPDNVSPSITTSLFRVNGLWRI